MRRDPRCDLLILAISAVWLLAATAVASGEEATGPQPSIAATQAGVVAVQNFTELLKAEAARAAEATDHDSKVIEHTLTTFEWIVGVVGALVLAGAAAVGWMMAKWNRTTITGIFQDEIKAQVEARVRAAEAENTSTLTRVVGLTEKLNKQQDIVTKLVTMTADVFPYRYLRDIYNKKTGKDPNQNFFFRDENAFKREMGFLIDNGFLKNVNLDSFKSEDNILDDLIITEKGKTLIELRETGTP